MGKIAVIALGGNAILRRGQKGTAEEQAENVRTACRQIARVVGRGYRVVVTHGNGPQVGNILIQNEAARDRVPAMPLDVCGAQSQGQIGYLLQRELGVALWAQGVPRPVVTVVTQVVVDPQDPAFRDPTKPVGPFYAEHEARVLMEAEGWVMREDAGRGWRRVVPSPAPRRVVELDAIRELVRLGAVVVAAGGGGVPVAEGTHGLRGVEAVIDKDLTAQRLATELGADLLAILTDVPWVYLHYGTAEQKQLTRVTASELEAYLREGHFAGGSMRAKVEGAIAFVRAGGERAVIAALDEALAAVEGQRGTQVLPDAVPETVPEGMRQAYVEIGESNRSSTSRSRVESSDTPGR